MSAPGITFADAAAAARRHWRSTAVLCVAAFAAGVIVGIVRPKQYQANVAFVPEQTKPRNLPTGLGVLAAQFGFDVSGDVGRSPQFYRDLVQTTGLLTQTFDSIVIPRPGQALTVRQLYLGSADSSRAGTDRTLRRLRRHLSAAADPRTSVITIGVLGPTPAAAERVAGVLVEEIQAFNVSTRQLQARQLRVFLETRTAEALQALHDAEDQLRRFYEQNRRTTDSPQLMFEETRLKRQLDLRQDLYTTLSKQLESTRIDEVNDTPAITVIDPPFASSRPAGPRAVSIGIVALLLALGLRTAIVLFLGR